MGIFGPTNPPRTAAATFANPNTGLYATTDVAFGSFTIPQAPQAPPMVNHPVELWDRAKSSPIVMSILHSPRGAIKQV